MKEEYVGKEIDEPKQRHGHIGGNHTDHQCETGDRQDAPCCGEISEGFDWSCGLAGCDAWPYLGRFFHGPAFLIPPARILGAAVFSFSMRPSPVRRRIASTSAGPAS